MASKQELIGPHSFQVHISDYDLARFYQELDQTLFYGKGEMNFSLGVMQDQHNGTFGSLAAELTLAQNLTPTTYQTNYTVDMTAFYRDRQDEYWTPEQLELMKRLISPHYLDSHVAIQNQNGGLFLLIPEPSIHAKYFSLLGYEDDDNKWQLQVTGYERLLKSKNLTERDYGQIATDLLKLQETGKPLSSFPRIVAGIASLETTSFFDPLLPFEKTTFIAQAKGFAEFAELTVNAAAQVKGRPQIGVFTLEPSLLHRP